MSLTAELLTIAAVSQVIGLACLYMAWKRGEM
jgi:hypothetical protein